MLHLPEHIHALEIFVEIEIEIAKQRSVDFALLIQRITAFLESARGADLLQRLNPCRKMLIA